MLRYFTLIFVTISSFSAVFAGEDPAKLARDALEKMDAAHLSLGDASQASDRILALSQTVRAFEDGLEALRESQRHAALRETAISREFEIKSAKVSQFLGVLLSVQSSTGPIALLHPSGPLGTARSGMIVSEITPAIQKQVAALKIQLEEISLLRGLQENAKTTLRNGLSGVQKARTELSQAISNRTKLPNNYLSDPSQLQSLIESVETLDGFASGLVGIEFSSSEYFPLADFRAAKGILEMPVAGNILRRFNETDAADVKRPGLLVATRSQALVTAPWAGTLRYIGPLLDYGNVIILEPDPSVLLVLAGLDKLYGELGQVVTQGTALGLMGGPDPDPDGFFTSPTNLTGSDATETLYIEVRMDGNPVDPANWFAKTKE